MNELRPVTFFLFPSCLMEGAMSKPSGHREEMGSWWALKSSPKAISANFSQIQKLSPGRLSRANVLAADSLAVAVWFWV
jgi:hypothetical protein